jgi:glycosyltransferase involved in cell wall biosynthesis
MTSSTEAPRSRSQGEEPFAHAGRAAAERRQQSCLPSGRVVVSCSARRGNGGLGRHLNEILAALERAGTEPACICGSTRASAGDPVSQAPRHRLGVPYLAKALSTLKAPAPPAVRARAFMVEFDAYAAGQLPAGEHLIAFNAQALTQLTSARRAGYRSMGLVSANSHVRQLARQHERARRDYPLEGSWTSLLIERMGREYRQAERIYVASRYIRDSFLEQGFPDELLADFPLTPDPRFVPAGAGAREERRSSERFDVVYVGSLAVHKGVPLLIDAFRRLAHADMRLVLVGGWGSRGMRRFVQGACAADPRIVVSPGDPLPHLRAAGVCVHPAYEDGFAYAPAEALACGVPAIVSEDTGMKELIDAPRTGLIVPTGARDALAEAIDAAYRGEVFGG